MRRNESTEREWIALDETHGFPVSQGAFIGNKSMPLITAFSFNASAQRGRTFIIDDCPVVVPMK
jgi:hypothetical protein